MVVTGENWTAEVSHCLSCLNHDVTQHGWLGTGQTGLPTGHTPETCTATWEPKLCRC